MKNAFVFAMASSVLIGSVAHATGNNQTVELSGGAVNTAITGGTAVMNIASTSGISSLSGNSQAVSIKGAVLNFASYGARSELNIASKKGGSGRGSSVVSVQGPVVSQASGRGVVNVVNIGGR